MLSGLVLLPALAASLIAGTLTYHIQPSAGSRLALEVEKTGLLSGKKHLFVFERYRGKLLYDRESPENSRVELAIDGTSAVCKDTWVKPKDLKKILDTALHEMMAVEQYPELRFSSSRVARRAGEEFEVTGTLTVRGISRPVTVTVTMRPSSGEVLLFAGKAVIKLKDYGLKPPSAALGAVGTKNEMMVDFLVTATLASPVAGKD